MRISTRRVAMAAGVAVKPGAGPLGKRIQAAMERAILEATKEGLAVDDPRVRARMLEARERVKNEPPA